MTVNDDQVTYESVEDVHLTDPNSVYFNVGLESESETSEVLSLPGSSEEVARLIKFVSEGSLGIPKLMFILEKFRTGLNPPV